VQRLLAFLEQNVHLIVLILLQALSFYLIFGLNPMQQAAFTHALSNVTGGVNNTVSSITSYFDLKEQNKQLQQQAVQDFSMNQSFSYQYLTDTFEVKDSQYQTLYSLVPASVVFNTIHKAENVFIINKGKNQGITKNMGVLSPRGVAGVVVKVGNNYSTVMSLLNTNMKLIPNINNTEYYNELKYNESAIEQLTIEGINKLEELKEGDTVRTGKTSMLFPADIPVGEITRLKTKPSSQYYTIEVKPTTSFRSLKHVYVVVNKAKEELDELLSDE
jgi:rod shape-determining protein MreC